MTNLHRMMMAASSTYDGIKTLGAHFDGTNDSVGINSLMSGLTDSRFGLISFWFNPANDDDGMMYCSAGGTADGRLKNERTTSETIKMSYRDAAGTEKVDHTSSTAILAGSGWHHFLQSWDLDTVPVSLLYIDGADESGGGKYAGTISYEGVRAGFEVGGTTATTPADLYYGDMAEFYFTTEFLDITSAANLQKFYTAGGNPADLGSDGSTPTGTQPFVYLRIAEGGSASDFGTNLGKGGAFSITGTLTLSATNPGD